MNEELPDLMQDMLRVQGDMAERLIEHRGYILAVELSFLAVVEQLSASGLVNARQAADRLIELSKQIEPPRFREKIESTVAATAKRLSALGEPKGPRPPRGSKPRIVK